MKLLRKLDNNALKILVTLFIFFIPLFPKFPFQVVNFTYIAIRLDDFFAVLITFVFVLNIVRGKINLKDLSFKMPFLLFWGAVILAFISGLTLTKTIDYPFIGLLHALRRVEYMIVFFIALSTIKTVKDFKLYMYALMASLSMIVVYGIGQRVFGFPAVSTMNPEFAKGRVLFLTPEARLSSTFAGHYDLGGYLVFYFPMVFAMLFGAQKWIMSRSEKILVGILGMFPIILTIYTLGKTLYDGSFGYILMKAIEDSTNVNVLLGMSLTLIIFMMLFDKARKVLFWLLMVACIGVLVATASRTSSIAFLAAGMAFLVVIKKYWYVPVVALIMLGFTSFDKDLVSRWLSTIQVKQVIVNEKTGEQVMVQKIRPDELPAGTSFVRRKLSDESSLSAKIKNELAIKQATLSGRLSPEDYTTYNAVAADISIATRFQVSWPRAWNAFMRNPLLGTGPSSITESSDGDYFRWIGETGALGTGTFLVLLYMLGMYMFKSRTKLKPEHHVFVYAVLFGIAGLLINALLIDIFEASKVAYMFWLTLGIFIGLLKLPKDELAKL